LIGSKSASDDHHRKNRIMIFGPKTDGTYVVEFTLAISIPRNEAGVIRHFQERCSCRTFREVKKAPASPGL
jgi:hypothetical protein